MFLFLLMCCIVLLLHLNVVICVRTSKNVKLQGSKRNEKR
jgi:hypothetical protein